MAETEIIVTKFVGDLGDLDTTVNGYEKALNKAGAASDSLDKKTTELSGSIGTLGGKFDVIKQSSERTTKEVRVTGKSIDELKAKLDRLTKNRNALIDPQSIARSNAEIVKVRDQIKNLEGLTVKAGKGGKELFGSITKGASQAAPGLSNVTSLFGGMSGPIGIAAAAVSGFIANFSRLDSVKTFFDAVKIGFDQVGDRLANLDFRSFFDPATQAKDAAFAAQVADALDRIEEAQLGVNKANAEAELKIAGLNQKLRDGTKSQEERVAIAGEIAEIERKRAEEEQGFIRVQVALQKGINAQQLKTLGEVSDANKAALNEREIALLQSQQRTVQLTETTERRVNAIVEQGEAERKGIAERARAAAEKQAAEDAKRAEARAQAQAKIGSIADSIAAEQLARTQTEAEKEVTATEAKFAALIKATQEGFAKLREVSAPEDQAALFKQEADQILAIDAAKNAELAANAQARAQVQAKTQEEQLEIVRKALLSETELQREAILVRFDEQRAAAEASIANAEERNAAILALTQKAQEDLALVLTDAQQKQLEQEKEATAERARLAQENATLISDFAVGATEIVAQAAAGNEDIAKNASKLLTALLLDTLEKVILANAFSVQAIAAGSPTPENVATGGVSGIIKGAILAGLVKALFAVAKAQIAGAYTGEERVGRGERPIWSGRDGYLRRVHKNEGIVDAGTNMAFLPEINTMRKGRKAYEDMIYREHIAPAIAALGYNDMGTVNNFVQSDTGQRIAQSVMLAKFYDANIVSALTRNGKQSRVQTHLLEQLVRQSKPVSARYR